MKARTIEYWSNWLTEDRLNRINHTRERVGEEPLTRELGVKALRIMEADAKDQRELAMFLSRYE